MMKKIQLCPKQYSGAERTYVSDSNGAGFEPQPNTSSPCGLRYILTSLDLSLLICKMGRIAAPSWQLGGLEKIQVPI